MDHIKAFLVFKYQLNDIPLNRLKYSFITKANDKILLLVPESGRFSYGTVLLTVEYSSKNERRPIFKMEAQIYIVQLSKNIK